MAYRSAIIGYGGMGSWHHQNIKEKVPQIEVVGAWDVRPERLQVAQENGLYAYGSLEELLNDERIDLVTVATPQQLPQGPVHRLHAPRQERGLRSP